MTDLTLSGLLTSFVDAHGITAFREPNVASNLLSDVLGDLSDLEPAKRQALVASVRDRTLARLLDRSPRTVDGWAADRATMAKPEWLYEAWAAPCDREVFPVEALADAGFGTFAVDVCRRLGLQPVRRHAQVGREVRRRLILRNGAQHVALLALEQFEELLA